MREEKINLTGIPKKGSIRFENRLEKKWSRKVCQDGLYFETRRREAPVRVMGTGSQFQ